MIGALLLCFFTAGLMARGQVAEWIQTLEGSGRFETVFFKPYLLAGGAVTVRRPPAESRSALDQMVSAAPKDADLLQMRARVDEEQLDFGAAEADWKKRAGILEDKAAGQMELADFYHRRLRPLDEVAALLRAAGAPSSPSDRLLPASQQRSWRAFERIYSVIDAQALPAAVAIENYRAWLGRYPRQAEVYSRYFNFLIGQKQFAEAGKLIGTYEKAFPQDKVFPVEARAWIEYKRGSAEQALKLYDQSFQPLWPPDLVKAYFSLLKETRHLRDDLANAREAVEAHPEDVNAAARLFYYFQQEGNIPEARRALLEYRLRMESSKSAWTAEQLWTLGRLFEGIHDYNEAARCYYALYSLPGAEPAYVEKALAGIINLLLTVPEQPIRFGSEDLTLLRDIGTLDPYPGFLNGILSLLLNSQQPASRYAQAENASTAYFHRARAAELLPLLDMRFPHSPSREELHAKLIEVYANYGANGPVIRDARKFLASFPKAPGRVHVAMLLADALARKHQVNDELAVYDSLLLELAARADHVPLGEQARQMARGEYDAPSQPDEESGQEEERPAIAGAPVPTPRVPASPPSGARSPEYSSVLERYIARLVALKRPLQAMALFKREIARNPNDPGLYERFAAFLDQNRMGENVEEVYRQAMKQFPDRSWYQKLARWYLRYHRAVEFENLSRQVTDTFSGSALQEYFERVVSTQPIDPQLYLQLNLYAHARFPHNLVFVNHLLDAYRRPPTADAAAWEALIRQHWYEDGNLRSQYFAQLSFHHRLDGDLQIIRRANPAAASGHWQELASANPAAAQFLFEAELWRSHFEAAAPVMRAVAADYPTDAAIASRAADVYRSLAAFDRKDTEIAAGIEETLSRYSPRNEKILTRIGEIYADREMFAKSRLYWNRIAELQPGRCCGFLDAATIFWDYFQFDDALRLIKLGRRKLAQPDLYAYEAGAIYENERDYPRAVREYLKGALDTEGDSPARSRLLQLAKRPKVGRLVDEATAKLAEVPEPAWSAVSLRVDVLEALGRREDLGKFLLALTQKTSSLDTLERLDPVVVRDGFSAIHKLELERRAALTHDPVERLRLQLARFREAGDNVQEGRQLIDSIYRANPAILGVVRARVDFYWNNKQWDPAIDTLLEAARKAYPGLSTQFTYEAVRKATEAEEYQRARDLLAPLLAGDPYNAEYLGAMADTYAREGNDQALRDFYLARIQAFRDAPLSVDERNQRIAALRRGLIPALTRLKDYAGAVAQYIEIINRYPEDETLPPEAAAYAEAHGRRRQLLDYYAKASADSPKDFRWPMVLARLETYFEDFPAAIADYTRAQSVRPDRSDLLMARETLEERLMRFDDAIRTATLIYNLTYQDPQWMEKVAGLHARQGQTDAAMDALRKAMIEGRPEKAEIYFNVAERLLGWNMLPQAREFAERGVSLAGQDLLTDPGNIEGLKTYATVMTRLRQYQPAFKLLTDAAQAAKKPHYTPSLLIPMRAMGEAVKTYFTPEEKETFENFLEEQSKGEPQEDMAQTFLPLAQAAGLEGLEVRWRSALMMLNPGSPVSRQQESQLEALQWQRMRFAELGSQLETYWGVFPRLMDRDGILERAAAAYRAEGDTQSEMRALGTAFAHQGLSGPALSRFLGLLRVRDPQRLVEIAGGAAVNAVRDAAANAALAGGDGKLALQVLAARGRGLPPIWTSAYTGLAGLYYADAGSEIGSAFQSALGTGTIGGRVGKPVDRAQQLAGNIWFYYGSRYGDYLAALHQGNPEDYLPAMLEGAPANPDAYEGLANDEAGRGDVEGALADDVHALELAPLRGEVDDRMAVILWKQGKREEAVARWRGAFQAFFKAEDGRHYPPGFWSDVRTALEHVGRRKLLSQVRDDANQVLQSYVRHNGTYEVDDLLKGAMAASETPDAGVAWIVELANLAPNRVEFLGNLADARWIPVARREPVLRRIVQQAEADAARAHGEAQSVALETLHSWQLRLVTYLLEAHRAQDARTAFEALPEDYRKQNTQEVTVAEIRLAALSGTLDAALARYDKPESAPPLDALRAAADSLRQAHDETSARRVLEFVYTTAVARHELTAANFLGLAEIKLQSGDASEAIALLRRMQLVAGEPFESLEPAADLLLKYKHPAEAMEFLSARVKAVPWDSKARLELARAQIAGDRDAKSGEAMLSAIAASSEAAYSQRVQAAKLIGTLKAGAASLGSGELDLLAKGVIAPAASEKPLHFDARVEAAQRANDPATQVRLLLGAIAIEPYDNSPRLPLFRASAGAGQNRLAYSAIEPLLNPYASNAYMDSDPAENSQADSADDTTEQVTFLPQLKLSDAEKAAWAAQLAEVLGKLGNNANAATYWNIASRLAPAGAEREKYQAGIKRVRAELKAERENTQRRPAVSEHLEQKVMVRPRVAMQQEAAPSVSLNGGGR